MSVVSIATLKSYFQTGDFPTQAQFEDLIDTLYGANILQVEVPLTASQMIILNSSPVDAVAAPGAGKAIEVVSSSYYFTITAGFASAFTLQIKSSGGSGAQHQSGAIPINLTGTYSAKMPDVTATTGERIKENAGLQIVSTGDVGAGLEVGSGSVKIAYRIIDYP